MDCTALVMSVGRKEGHVQLRQLFIAEPFRQSTTTKAVLRGALVALNQSKSLKRGTQYEEGLRLPWEEVMVLCARAWQLGKCDIGGKR